MCGVAGHAGPARVAASAARSCLDRLGRRGPDHAAWKSWSGPRGAVELGHTRLSIIDLDPRSHQPFYREGLWVAFNGEIYNHVELRDALVREGLRFETTSDTEVLLALWRREGPAALDRLEGMWAFAMYDERDGSLTLARDRFGEKPLFLWDDGTDLYFASEVKGLAALRGAWPRVNGDQVRRFLVNGYKSLYKGTDTFFQDVRSLPAGHWRRRTADGKTTEGAYWAPRPAPEKDMTFEEAVAGTRERLFRSVEWRLRADVPLAFCLSGGVDSNALIAVAKRRLGFDAHGFTVANTDPRYEERDVIEAAVADLKVRHTWVAARTEGFLENLRRLVDYHDAPVYTISYYLHGLLMEAVHRAGYKVSISGTGADELFTGYFDHHLFYLAERRGDPAGAAEARANWEREVKPYVRNPFLKDPDRIAADPSFRDHIFLDADKFAAYLRTPWREAFAEERYTANVLRNRMLNELFHEAIPVILHEDDANAMYHSIENRSPYLDRSLFEFSLTIPTRHLIRGGRAKAVLREAVRGIAPAAVLDNPRKVGFNAPVLDLLDPRDPAVRDWVLADGPLGDYLDPDRVRALLDKDVLPNSESKMLFNIVSTKMFLEGRS